MPNSVESSGDFRVIKQNTTAQTRPWNPHLQDNSRSEEGAQKSRKIINKLLQKIEGNSKGQKLV
jgi:hypothetical protein